MVSAYRYYESTNLILALLNYDSSSYLWRRCFVVKTLVTLLYLGANTVVHPNVRILAEGGPIIIGEDNLIKEGTTIINKSACVHACACVRVCMCVHVCVCVFFISFFRKQESDQRRALIIGNGNVFDVGVCILPYFLSLSKPKLIVLLPLDRTTDCAAGAVGDYNTFEMCCQVEDGVKITENCFIGAKCHVISKEELAPKTVVYGSGQERWILKKVPKVSTPQQLALLSKTLPNYHKLIKIAPATS